MTGQSAAEMFGKHRSGTRRVNRSRTGGVDRPTLCTDPTLGWVQRDYPQLAAWRTLAVTWLQGETKDMAKRLVALSAFFEKYLVQHELSTDPAVFFKRSTPLPDFYSTAWPDSKYGIRRSNIIHDFLNFVLLREFSATDD